MSEMMPPQLQGAPPIPGSAPPGLADLLGGMGGGQMPTNPDEQNEPQDPLSALQDVIEDAHKLIVVLRDPQDVDMAVKALGVFTAIQRRLMGGNGSPQGS